MGPASWNARALLPSKFDSCRRGHDRRPRPGVDSERRDRRAARRCPGPRPRPVRDRLTAMEPVLRPPGGGGPTAGPEGSVTVELAAAIPLLVAVTLAMVGLLGLARDQVLAQGAAREGARQAAIGGDRASAVAAARAALPAGRQARVVVADAGAGRVGVRVELPVRQPFGVPLVTVRATAVAALEPGPPLPPATGP